jgi:uncharacterized protein YecE (DUF72 family)
VNPGLHVGCCGFPVARDRYFPEFDAVEISTTVKRVPRRETVERWKAEAPRGFTFSVRAPRDVCGGDRPFRPGPKMKTVWSAFKETLEILSPAFVVYETPKLFYPSADHTRAMYEFFKGPGRGPWRSVWIPRGRHFDERLRGRIVSDLNLTLGADALLSFDAPRGTRYWRLSGRSEGRRISRGVSFTDEELREAVSRCAGGRSAYLFFDNAAMWRDARRMKKYCAVGRF